MPMYLDDLRKEKERAPRYQGPVYLDALRPSSVGRPAGLGWIAAVVQVAAYVAAWVIQNWDAVKNFFGDIFGGDDCGDVDVPADKLLPDPRQSSNGRPYSPQIKETQPIPAGDKPWVVVPSETANAAMSAQPYWEGNDWILPTEVMVLENWATRWIEEPAKDGRVLTAVLCPMNKGWACRTHAEFPRFGGKGAKAYLATDYVRMKEARPGTLVVIQNGAGHEGWRGVIPARGVDAWAPDRPDGEASKEDKPGMQEAGMLSGGLGILLAGSIGLYLVSKLFGKKKRQDKGEG